MKRDGRILRNLLVGGLGQFLTILLSLFVPRLLLTAYGSDVNGLISTVTQVFSCLLILEYGIGHGTINRLYQDIAAGDERRINHTLSAARTYLHRVMVLYGLLVAALMLIFPSLLETAVPAEEIRQIILLQGLSGMVNFAFANTYNMLLSAEGRGYVQTSLNLLCRCVTVFGQLILIQQGFAVADIQIVFLLAAILRAVVTRCYVRRKYPFLHLEKGVSPRVLEQKGAYFIHELSSVIFFSTDVFVVGLCCGTKMASVYAIYQLVFRSLRNILNIFPRSVSFRLGQLYHEDGQKYILAHDRYETAYSVLMFACMTVTLYLTLPFIRLYTQGIYDADYIDGRLPLLFALIELLSAGREACSKLIATAGHARRTIPNTLLESALNLVLSLVLATFIGIYGVLLGSIAALLYRSNDIILYANRKILRRQPRRCYRNQAVFFSLFALNVLVSQRYSPAIHHFGAFLLYGILLTMGLLLLYGLAAWLMNRDLR